MTVHDDARPISQRVIEAVADETDTTPTDLDPLYDTLDPDCLDDLFRNVPSAASHREYHVAFRMAGCQVVVSHDGSVDVSSATGDAATQPSDLGSDDSSPTFESPD